MPIPSRAKLLSSKTYEKAVLQSDDPLNKDKYGGRDPHSLRYEEGHTFNFSSNADVMVAKNFSFKPAAEVAVYDYMRNDLGISKNQALGLMANMMRESSFNQSKVNETIDPSTGIKEGSSGLFQWNPSQKAGERLQSMIARVPNWRNDWKAQIRYALGFDDGMEGSYRKDELRIQKKAVKKYLSTDWDSPEAAADYWMKEYESPRDRAASKAMQDDYLKKLSAPFEVEGMK